MPAFFIPLHKPDKLIYNGDMKNKNKSETISGRLFCTADLHLNHGNILKYCNRPWMTEEEREQVKQNPYFRPSRSSVGQMDDHLIEGINNTVGEDDTLYHLGDFCFAPEEYYFETAKRYRDRIKCKNVFSVWGNHDDPSIAPLFSGSENLTKLWVGRQHLILSHTACAIWERDHKNAFNLYGHSHSTAEQWLDNILPGRRSMDVGVDNAAKILGSYRPFSYDEIYDILSKRPGVKGTDHHK